MLNKVTEVASKQCQVTMYKNMKKVVVIKRKKANLISQAKPLSLRKGKKMATKRIIQASDERQSIYIGIDAHKNSWSFTVLKSDEIVERKTLRADPVQLSRFIGKYQNYRIVSAYEAGYCGFGLHYQLIHLGVENMVVSASKMPTIAGDRVKTDKRDSLKLATFLSKGLLTPIYIPPKELIQIREVIRLRDSLVKKRTAAINQFKAILMKNSIVFEFEGYQKKAIEEFLETTASIPDLVRSALLVHAQKMHLYTEQLRFVDKQAENEAVSENYREVYERIRSVPGVGGTVGRVLLFEIGDFKRFDNERKIAAYCGLTPVEYSSGENVKRGRITGQGQQYLRRLLIQAAWQAIRTDTGINEFYERMVRNSGNKKKAIVAVARKLLCVVLSVVKQQRLYKPKLS